MYLKIEFCLCTLEDVGSVTNFISVYEESQ